MGAPELQYGSRGSQHRQCSPGFTGGSSNWNSQVSWTGRERIRCPWYRFRLPVAEMNYATRRLVELQTRLPRQPPASPSGDDSRNTLACRRQESRPYQPDMHASPDKRHKTRSRDYYGGYVRACTMDSSHTK
jgi:hypothetical protein